MSLGEIKKIKDGSSCIFFLPSGRKYPGPQSWRWRVQACSHLIAGSMCGPWGWCCTLLAGAVVGTAVWLPASVLFELLELCLQFPEERILQRVLRSWGLMNFCVCVCVCVCVCFEVNTQKVEANIHLSVFVQTVPSSLAFCFPAHERLSGTGLVTQSFPASREYGVWSLCSGAFASLLTSSTDRNPHWILLLCSHTAFYSIAM